MGCHSMHDRANVIDPTGKREDQRKIGLDSILRDQFLLSFAPEPDLLHLINPDKCLPNIFLRKN